ncbi:MAG: UvrD-helicase domain-containing protein, partial [Candidatus Hydrogenedentota bacterium]
MPADFSPNEAQRRAIAFPIDRPLKVVAGAGTGKTAVLTHRFIHIVERYRIPPHRILALTFTKKAAAEVQSRITKKLLQKGLINRSEVPLLLWIGNFHSVCLRLLKQSPFVVGLDPSFAIVEETEQRLLFAEVVDDFLNKRLNTDADADAFEALMIERVDEFVQSMLALVNRLKDNFIKVEDLKQTVEATLSKQYRTVERILNETVANEAIPRAARNAAQRRLESLAAARAHERLLKDAAYEIYRAYQDRLERQDLLDFSDLIFHTYRLAQIDPSVKRRFDYILVDEFQDTDHGQYRLLEALSEDFNNVTVVGDKKQSIYEWREARIENIDNFPGETILLGENYRSFGEILDSANFFISQSMPAEHPLTPAPSGGRGRADAARVSLFRADSRAAEAEYVAREIGRLIEIEGCEPGEIVVLMRSVHASRPYEDALRCNGIPHTTVGGCGFYDLSETKDLLALLRLISNPFDDVSMVRMLQSATVGLSDAALHEICKCRSGSESSLYDVLKNSKHLLEGFRPRTRERLQELVSMVDELASTRWSLTTGELISEVLDKTRYLKYLSSLEGPRGPRFSNVALFYKMATLFEERHPSAALDEFLSYLDNAIAGGVGGTPGDPGADSVQLMTVHQAKGLEFRVVFAVNLGTGTFPLKFRAGDFGYDEKFGLFTRRLPQGGPTVRYEGGYGIGIEEHLRRRQYLEENRIMYVAMTRARDLLYLTTCTPKNGDSKDFFHLIEGFASGSGSRCAEVTAPVSAPASLSGRESGVVAHMAVQDIKRLATKAVRRITQQTPARIAPEASGTIVLSYSRLAVFRHCPMKYALRYLYGLPLSPHEESQDES